MRGRLIQFGARAAAVAAVLLALLWARSGSTSDLWWWSFGGTEVQVESDWGRVVLTLIARPAGAAGPTDAGWVRRQGGWHGAAPGPRTYERNLGAVEYTAGIPLAPSARAGPPRVLSGSYRRVLTYHPVLMVLALLLALPWLRRRTGGWRARRRASAGLCARCGYDVRASAARCPECGEATSGQATASPA